MGGNHIKTRGLLHRVVMIDMGGWIESRVRIMEEGNHRKSSGHRGVVQMSGWIIARSRGRAGMMMMMMMMMMKGWNEIRVWVNVVRGGASGSRVISRSRSRSRSRRYWTKNGVNGKVG